MCICVRICVCTYVYVYMCICVYVYVYVYVHMYIRAFSPGLAGHTSVAIQRKHDAPAHIYIYTYIHISTYAYIYTHIHIYMSTCIYIQDWLAILASRYNENMMRRRENALDVTFSKHASMVFIPRLVFFFFLFFSPSLFPFSLVESALNG